MPMILPAIRQMVPHPAHQHHSLCSSCLVVEAPVLILFLFFLAFTNGMNSSRKLKKSFRNGKSTPRLPSLEVTSDKVYTKTRASLKNDRKNPLAQAKGIRLVTRQAFQNKLGVVMIGILRTIHDSID